MLPIYRDRLSRTHSLLSSGMATRVGRSSVRDSRSRRNPTRSTCSARWLGGNRSAGIEGARSPSPTDSTEFISLQDHRPAPFTLLPYPWGVAPASRPGNRNRRRRTATGPTLRRSFAPAATALERRPLLRDVNYHAIQVGDTVTVPVPDWTSGVAKWMAHTSGEVVGLGRTRVTVRFRGQDRVHTLPALALSVVQGAKID
jgi:hypothetical protein